MYFLRIWFLVSFDSELLIYSFRVSYSSALAHRWHCASRLKPFSRAASPDKCWPHHMHPSKITTELWNNFLTDFTNCNYSSASSSSSDALCVGAANTIMLPEHIFLHHTSCWIRIRSPRVETGRPGPGCRCMDQGPSRYLQRYRCPARAEHLPAVFLPRYVIASITSISVLHFIV